MIFKTIHVARGLELTAQSDERVLVRLPSLTATGTSAAASVPIDRLRAALDEVAPRDQAAAPEVDDAMVERAARAAHGYPTFTGVPWHEATSNHRANLTKEVTRALRAALTPEPPRPEGAEELDKLIGAYLDSTPDVGSGGLADHLARQGVRAPSRDYCGRGPCCLEDGHDGECKL